MTAANANSTWIEGVAELVSKAARGQTVRVLFSKPERLYLFQAEFRSRGLQLRGDRWYPRRGGWIEARLRTDGEQWAIDERELRRFLNAGTSDFEGSTFGFMLDRAALFAFGSTECRRCRERFPCTTCRRCKRGEVCRRPTFGNPTGFVGDTSCPDCGGLGVRERRSRHRARGPVTAQPTCPAPRSGGVEPDDGTMLLHGRVSRAFDLLTAHAPKYAMVLRVYYSSAGGEGALLPITDAGRRLALQLSSTDKSDHDARQLLDLANAHKNRSVEESRALTQARKEARRLRYAAKKAYQAALAANVDGIRHASKPRPADALERLLEVIG